VDRGGRHQSRVGGAIDRGSSRDGFKAFGRNDERSSGARARGMPGFARPVDGRWSRFALGARVHATRCPFGLSRELVHPLTGEVLQHGRHRGVNDQGQLLLECQNQIMTVNIGELSLRGDIL